MTSEVTVANPGYWSDRALQLAQILGTARATQTIGDPTGRPPDPERLFAISDPAYWSTQPSELNEVLRIASLQVSGVADVDVFPGAAGATQRAQERLTLTVEEAAAALGISRSFAYEAVYRNEIPHVRIGRRILVPKRALQRMLDQTQESE